MNILLSIDKKGYVVKDSRSIMMDVQKCVEFKEIKNKK